MDKFWESSCGDCVYAAREIHEEPCNDCIHGEGCNMHFEPKNRRMEITTITWEDEIFHGLDESKENHCMKCGAIIPEGRHICLSCEGTNEMQTFQRRTPTEVSSKPTETPTASDAVNHPAHYQGAHECIDEMLALFGVEAVKGFCMCNVYKYRYRADKKNGAEDIKKADWYMSKLMELEETQNE